MLRALIVAGVAGIAAVAGRQLYRDGTLQRWGDQLKVRGDQLKRHVDDRLQARAAAHEAAGGPGGGPVRPVAVHDHKIKAAH